MDEIISISELKQNGDIAFAVLEGHTLGYIRLDNPHYFIILKSSIEKGAPWSCTRNILPLLPSSDIQLAGRSDFLEFNVEYQEYENDSVYRYIFNENTQTIKISIPPFNYKHKHQ